MRTCTAMWFTGILVILVCHTGVLGGSGPFHFNTRFGKRHPTFLTQTSLPRQERFYQGSRFGRSGGGFRIPRGQHFFKGGRFGKRDGLDHPSFRSQPFIQFFPHPYISDVEGLETLSKPEGVKSSPVGIFEVILDDFRYVSSHRPDPSPCLSDILHIDSCKQSSAVMDGQSRGRLLEEFRGRDGEWGQSSGSSLRVRMLAFRNHPVSIRVVCPSYDEVSF
ncbi:unnamed protein product [Darwinula stevensoni]|uniref:Uncharacterized protein n=1 Tax=Darwinula stevensoni TaxID=69355 RepID=A0A7R8X9J4_9CRUS|nr:unnamed protein product [Darwinula stevensoni]CAG0891144.1 unnamed protein product [Darwinula stevensoni]